MTKRKPPEKASDLAELRRKAESRFSRAIVETAEDGEAGDAARLLHELHVHQIELEVQNEELSLAREEAAALLEKYLDLYDFAPAGYFTLDVEGAVRQVNLAGATLLGVPRRELAGRRLAHFLSRESRPVFEAFFTEVMVGRHGLTCDVSLPREGKRADHVQLGGTAFESSPDCRITMIDVTERRRAEEEMERHRNNLEELVRARSAELLRANEELRLEVSARRQATESIALLNEALRGQVERVLEANRELDAFSYSVSHDLRAPLRAIDGFARLLSESRGEELTTEEGRLLGVILKNASHMGRLIDGLLRFATTSRSDLKTTPVAMKALADEVVAELVPPAERDRTLVRVAPLSAAQGDPDLLRVVWENLVGNALKFSAGRPLPEVEIGSTDGDGETVYSVRDNGVGFDPKAADRLFGVFQRLHPADTFEGTGIGLALVKRIVERHGGRVFAEGKVDGGATFSFALPRKA